jgi:hypothetical protein
LYRWLVLGKRRDVLLIGIVLRSWLLKLLVGISILRHSLRGIVVVYRGRHESTAHSTIARRIPWWGLLVSRSLNRHILLDFI